MRAAHYDGFSPPQESSANESIRAALQEPQLEILKVQHTKKKTKLMFKSYLQPAMASMPLEGLCRDFGFDRKWDVTEQRLYIPFPVPCSLAPAQTSLLGLPCTASSTTVMLQPHLELVQTITAS